MEPVDVASKLLHWFHFDAKKNKYSGFFILEQSAQTHSWTPSVGDKVLWTPTNTRRGIPIAAEKALIFKIHDDGRVDIRVYRTRLLRRLNNFAALTHLKDS